MSTSAGLAPADDYFGPHHHSILEIRNRLQDLERKNDEDMLAPDVVIGLDDLEASIVDWQRHYAADPWLPEMFAELLHEYQRADDVSSPRAMAALALMRSAYPDAPETSATVAAIYGSQPLPVAPSQAAPIVPYVQSVPTTQSLSPEWARFDSLRYSIQNDDGPQH
ncbi:MAG: hypothetical protein ACYDGM_00565 [Vulcanimicrobiaceae bacterium]